MKVGPLAQARRIPTLGIFAALVVLGAVGLSPARTSAQIQSAELRVDGLVCPFCAFGIEKKLRRVEGVESVRVSLDDGRVDLVFRRDASATAAALERAVDEAGFELLRLRVVVRGKMAGDGAGMILDAGARVRFRLTALHAEQALPAIVGDWRLRISGEVLERTSALPEIRVERVERVETVELEGATAS